MKKPELLWDLEKGAQEIQDQDVSWKKWVLLNGGSDYEMDSDKLSVNSAKIEASSIAKSESLSSIIKSETLSNFDIVEKSSQSSNDEFEVMSDFKCRTVSLGSSIEVIPSNFQSEAGSPIEKCRAARKKNDYDYSFISIEDFACQANEPCQSYKSCVMGGYCHEIQMEKIAQRSKWLQKTASSNNNQSRKDEDRSSLKESISNESKDAYVSKVSESSSLTESTNTGNLNDVATDPFNVNFSNSSDDAILEDFCSWLMFQSDKQSDDKNIQEEGDFMLVEQKTANYDTWLPTDCGNKSLDPIYLIKSDNCSSVEVCLENHNLTSTENSFENSTFSATENNFENTFSENKSFTAAENNSSCQHWLTPKYQSTNSDKLQNSEHSNKDSKWLHKKSKNGNFKNSAGYAKSSVTKSLSAYGHDDASEKIIEWLDHNKSFETGFSQEEKIDKRYSKQDLFEDLSLSRYLYRGNKEPSNVVSSEFDSHDTIHDFSVFGPKNDLPEEFYNQKFNANHGNFSKFSVPEKRHKKYDDKLVEKNIHGKDNYSLWLSSSEKTCSVNHDSKIDSVKWLFKNSSGDEMFSASKECISANDCSYKRKLKKHNYDKNDYCSSWLSTSEENGSVNDDSKIDTPKWLFKNTLSDEMFSASKECISATDYNYEKKIAKKYIYDKDDYQNLWLSTNSEERCLPVNDHSKIDTCKWLFKNSSRDKMISASKESFSANDYDYEEKLGKKNIYSKDNYLCSWLSSSEEKCSLNNESEIITSKWLFKNNSFEKMASSSTKRDLPALDNSSAFRENFINDVSSSLKYLSIDSGNVNPNYVKNHDDLVLGKWLHNKHSHGNKSRESKKGFSGNLDAIKADRRRNDSSKKWLFNDYENHSNCFETALDKNSEEESDFFPAFEDPSSVGKPNGQGDSNKWLLPRDFKKPDVHAPKFNYDFNEQKNENSKEFKSVEKSKGMDILSPWLVLSNASDKRKKCNKKLSLIENDYENYFNKWLISNNGEIDDSENEDLKWIVAHPNEFSMYRPSPLLFKKFKQ